MVNAKSVICLLLANDMSPVSDMCFASIRRVSSGPIVIGITHDAQRALFPADPNIIFLDLSASLSLDGLKFLETDTKYRAYTNNDFFRVVQLKWDLISKTMRMFPEHNVLFSDFDVLWISNPLPHLEVFLSSHPNCQIVIQDNSTDLNLFAVCMGFVYFRNNRFTNDMILSLASRHEVMGKIAPIGDDAIMSEYLKSEMPMEKYHVLPLHLFPTGNLSKLFLRKELFPGFKAPSPYIFHANYVSGLRKKALLMYLVARRINLSMSRVGALQRMSFSLEVILRRIKYLPLTRFFRSS